MFLFLLFILHFLPPFFSARGGVLSAIGYRLSVDENTGYDCRFITLR